MRRWRRTVPLLLAGVLVLGLGPASLAANLDLDEMGAVLALPVVTGDSTFTAITITNGSLEPVDLHIEVVNGDEGEQWESASFSCHTTPNESTLFVFSSDGDGSRVGIQRAEVRARPPRTGTAC